MKVTKFEAGPDLTFSTTGEDRAPGLHLSDIIKTMQFERDAKFNPDRPLDYMLLEQGHTWEEVLAHAIQRRWLAANPIQHGYRPDQLNVDGVWMSPDWFEPKDADYGVPLVEEWKATKTSQNKVLEDHQWYWVVQLKSYLYGMSKKLNQRLTQGRFRVWYINGDYTWESKNSDLTLLRGYVRYDVEFGWREIVDNWKSVIQQAKKHGLLEQAPTNETTEDTTWDDRKTPPTTKSTTANRRSRSSSPPETLAPASRRTTRLTSRPSSKRRSE